MPGEHRYWLYLTSPTAARIHREDCTSCTPTSLDDEATPPVNWYGFYATRGAAYDAARVKREKVLDCSCMKWPT